MGVFLKLPIPYWLTMMILVLLQTLLMHGLAWIDGWLPVFHFDKILLLFPAWLWGPIGIMIHLNSIAVQALEGFRPLIPQDDQVVAGLRREFSTTRTKGLIINAVIWLAAYLITNFLAFAAIKAFGYGTFFTDTIFVEGLISYLIGGAIYYYSLRQLLLVHQTVKLVKHINLFDLDPVYSFSRLTSRIGIAWVVLASVTLLLFPLTIATTAVVAVLAVQMIFAVAAFVLPLGVIHSQLVADKRKLLAEHNLHMQQILKQLHGFLSDGDLEKAGQLKLVLESMNFEYTALMRIPTWPWRAGTLTGFATSIVLPVAIFLIQLFIRQMLGV